MAHVDITGTQHYALGIGQPKNDTSNSPPAVLATDGSGNAIGIIGQVGGVPNQVIALGGGGGISELLSVAGAGDSIQQGATPGGSMFMQSVKRQTLPYKFAGNFAVASKRTDEIAAQIPSAAASGAKICVIDGGVNDILQAVPEATLRANLIANWNACKAAGMEPLDVGLPPTNTGANVPRYVAHEVWRKLYCYKYNIRHADIWSPLATAAGAYTSGLNLDAVHPNSIGGVAAEPSISNLIAGPTKGSYPLLALTDTKTDAGSAIDNAVSFSGTLNSNGWFNIGSGATYSVTAPDAGDFGSWYRTTCTAAVNAGLGSTTYTLASLGWAIGDKIAIGFRLRWVDVAGALSITCFAQSVTGLAPSQPLFNETGGATGNSIYSYTEFTFTGGTSISLQFFATGTGYFEINRPIMVNLTKLGLA